MGLFDDPAIVPGKVLDQPFAGAVLLAAQGHPGKRIETRTTRITRVPCEIVIIAGVTVQPVAMTRVWHELVDRRGVPQAAFDRAMALRGVAVAVARVTECRRLTEADADDALWWDAEENARKPRWAWCLGDLRPLRPFSVRGIPGFARVPRAAIVAAL